MKVAGIPSILIMLIINFGLNTGLAADYCWIQKASVASINRYAAMGFSINGKGYVTGGNNLGTGLNDLWEYDPVLDIWTQKSNFPGTGRWAGAGFAISGKGYITTGTNIPVYLNDTYEYDPITNTWATKAPFPAIARQDCFGFSANNFGYVFGGFRSGTYYNTLYRFDPVSNSWNTQTSMPAIGRDGIRGFVLGNIAYICGGWNGSTPLNDVYAYDALTDTWMTKASIPGPSRHSCSAFEMNGKGFAGNGYNNASSYYTDFYEYDPVLDSWQPIPSFPGQTIGYTVCFTIGNNGYISTGRYNVLNVNSNQTWQLALKPSATFTYSNLNCSTTISFNNTSSPNLNFIWDFGDGSGSTSISPTHTYSANGTYSVMLVADNGACTDTLVQQITIQSPPSASFTYNTSCSYVLNVNNTSINALNYTWLWGDGSQNTGNQNTHTYSAPGQYTVTLIAANGLCADTLIQLVSIDPQPLASFTPIPDCNLGVNIVNNSSFSSQYLVDWGDGTYDSILVNYHNYTLPGNYTITLVAIGGNCSDTSLQTVNISITPEALINHWYNDCHDTVFVESTNIASSYYWDFGDGTISNTSFSSHTYTLPGTYPIILIVSNANCSDTALLSVSTVMSVDTSITSIISCDGHLNALTNCSASNTYLWNTGDGTSYSGCNISHQYNSYGQYLLELNVSNGYCSKYNSILIDVPQPVEHIINVALDSCTGIASFSITPSTNSTVFWDFGDGQNSSQASPIHHFGNQSIYLISVIIEPGEPCADTVEFNLDLHDFSFSNLFIPNVFTPNDDGLNDYFRLFTTPCNFENVTIYNRWGMQIFSSDNPFFQWNGYFNNHPTPEGVYVVIITSQKKIYNGTLTLLR